MAILGNKGIIKTSMAKRGYKHRRPDAEFTISGEYARNIQFVYAQEFQTQDGVVIDLIYFAADMVAENLVMGLYRENLDVENGVILNTTRSLSLANFTEASLEKELDKLLVPIRNLLK